MRYELVEITSDGLVSHKAETAEQALSLWYALDGDVQTIRNENRQEVSLAELRAAATAEKAQSPQPVQSVGERSERPHQ
jgi:hypothetical protein